MSQHADNYFWCKENADMLRRVFFFAFVENTPAEIGLCFHYGRSTGKKNSSFVGLYVVPFRGTNHSNNEYFVPKTGLEYVPEGIKPSVIVVDYQAAVVMLVFHDY